MEEHLFNVEDVFSIENRGVVVSGVIPAEWLEDEPRWLYINQQVEVQQATGAVLRTTIIGIERFPECFPTIPRRVGVGILLSPNVTQDDLPHGTIIYLKAMESENNA